MLQVAGLQYLEEVLRKLSGVKVQVAGYFTTTGGIWYVNQVLWKLQEFVVRVAGLVRVPGGS